MGLGWTQNLREEFKVEKLTLSSRQPELLLQPRWNIPPWAWLLYRIAALLYTLGWCVHTALLFKTAKCLIFLSHISYSLMALYFFSAVCNLVASFTLVRRHCRVQQGNGCPDSLGPLPSPLRLSVSLQWFLHIIQGPLAITVAILYWTTNYPFNHHPVSAFSVNLHAVNVLQSLLDLALSATPVHLCHFPYLLLTGSLYVLFVLLYWLAGFTNIGGQHYIYSVFDFAERPLVATLCVLGFLLFCLPLCHFTMWNVALLRERVAAGPRGRQLGLLREAWWWGAVGGRPARPLHLDPASSVFGLAGADGIGDGQRAPLTRDTFSYHAVTVSEVRWKT